MKMPVLFVGHGSPMNAIEENAYTQRLRDEETDKVTFPYEEMEFGTISMRMVLFESKNT